MRSLYMTYAEDEKLAPMVRELGWSHNISCGHARVMKYDSMILVCLIDQDRLQFIRIFRCWSVN